MSTRLPDIHEWWPRLSIDGKHVLRDGDGDIPDEVREEISRIAGEDVPEGATLSEDDRDFIRTQSEQVD